MVGRPAGGRARAAGEARHNGGVNSDIAAAAGVDELVASLAFNADGLVPAIVQEAQTRQVLMLAWMDAEAVRRTLGSGRATYWSRSRGVYWVKGETSGHHQHVRELRADCDHDTLLLVVDQVGAACHTGSATCFDAAAFRPAANGP